MDNTAQKSLPLSGQTFLFSTVECGKPMRTLHKARLTALHAICVQIFRHIAQKSLAIRLRSRQDSAREQRSVALR